MLRCPSCGQSRLFNIESVEFGNIAVLPNGVVMGTIRLSCPDCKYAAPIVEFSQSYVDPVSVGFHSTDMCDCGGYIEYMRLPSGLVKSCRKCGKVVRM